MTLQSLSHRLLLFADTRYGDINMKISKDINKSKNQFNQILEKTIEKFLF